MEGGTLFSSDVLSVFALSFFLIILEAFFCGGALGESSPEEDEVDGDFVLFAFFLILSFFFPALLFLIIMSDCFRIILERRAAVVSVESELVDELVVELDESES